MKQLKHHALFSLPLILCFIHCKTFAQQPKDSIELNKDSIAVVATVNNFLDAFANLNWEKFTGFFAEDATVFFPPSAKFAERANNKTEIENIFKNVFDNARKQKPAPPYIIIQPKDIKIQMLGNVAIVSFILNDPGLLGRRTIVFKKYNDQWLIIHLHASGIATTQ